MSCTVEITKIGQPAVKVVLTQSGGSDENLQSFDGHVLKFNVTPYPTAGKTIAAGDYRLNLTVLKVAE